MSERTKRLHAMAASPTGRDLSEEEESLCDEVETLEAWCTYLEDTLIGLANERHFRVVSDILAMRNEKKAAK